MATQTVPELDIPRLMEALYGEQPGVLPLPEQVERALERLTTKEQEVIRRRFGMPKESLKGVGKRIERVDGKEGGVSRERIRQIEARALRKLRHPSRRKYLELI